MPDADLARQREVVDAFIAAAREGDFDALLALLDPDVVLRADRPVPPGAPTEVRGAHAVAERALSFSGAARFARPAVVNGAAGFVVAPHGRQFAVVGCTFKGGKIIEMDVVADATRLRELDVSILDVQ